MFFKSIGHVAYRVRNMEASVKFYQDVFGMEVIHKIPTPDKGTIVFVGTPDRQSLELFEGGEDELNITGKTAGYIHLCLIVDNFAELVEHVKELGVPFYQEPRFGEDLSSFRILDPDGNELEVVERSEKIPF
ncbi:MAG: VOC family protein [Clostridia bacterium]|nr:VOC family protein [Clostridia bacterium]